MNVQLSYLAFLVRRRSCPVRLPATLPTPEVMHEFGRLGIGFSNRRPRECLTTRAGRHSWSDDVLHCLSELFLAKGVPEHIRYNNGPAFTAKVVRSWLGMVGAKTLYINPGSPWENGYIEGFKGKLRDEYRGRDIFIPSKRCRCGLSSGDSNRIT